MSSPRWLLARLTVLTALGVAGLGILAMPAGGPLADWCRVDGRVDVVRAAIVVSPLLAAIALAALRWRTLRDVRPEKLLAHGIAMAALTGLLAAALALTPGRATTLPDATLIDQDGQPFALRDLRGSPVLVSAVYSRCSTACPMALAELTRVLGALTPEERSALHVVLITLDPEHDTPARLHEIAAGYGLSAPSTRFLTGDPPLVERLLDDLRFERRRDPTTGVIEHEAEFLMVDADGRITARFPSGAESERLLVATLRSLLESELSEDRGK